MSMQGKLYFLNYDKIVALFADDSSSANARILKRADHDYLDWATYDFAVEIKVKWDNSILNQSSDHLLIGKGRFDQALANTGGWAVILQPSTASLKILLNDGNPSAASSVWTGALPADTAAFLRFEFDRNTGVRLYKNGSLVSLKTEITGRTGSVSNSEPLHIGGYSGLSTSWFKGTIEMVRLDYGYTALDKYGAYYPVWAEKYPGDMWNYEAYLRYAHFWPESAYHYLAAWYFNLTLEDTAPFGFDLSCYQGDGSTVGAGAYYTSADVWGDGYAWSFQPLPGELVDSHLDLDARLRGLDGTMKVYKGPRKRTRYMVFRTTDVEQVIALQGAWYQTAPISLHTNQEQAFDFRGYLTYPPTVTEIARRGDFRSTSYLRVWEIELEMEEA